MKDILRKGVTGHLIAHWGVPCRIHPPESESLGVAVLEFAPGGRLSSWRYATNGLSAFRLPTGKGGARMELFASTEGSCPWAIDLLRALVKYAVGRNVYLGEGDTIPVERPIDRDRSPYTALFIAPPAETEAVSLGAARCAGEVVFFHQVIGAYRGELDLARQAGIEVVWERLAVRGSEPLLDVARPPLG